MIVNSPEYLKLRTLLGQYELFDECNETEMTALLHASYPKKVARGKFVYESGDFARDIYILLNGGVKLCSEAPGQRPKVIQLIYPMDIFGLFDVLSNERRDLSATAISLSEVLVVDGDAFTGLLKENAGFSVKILSGWGARFREFSSWCFRYNHYGAREKVAAYLIKEFGSCDHQRPPHAMPTRRDIASLLGITPETLSRELSYFRQRGWVRVEKNGDLSVADSKSLGYILQA